MNCNLRLFTLALGLLGACSNTHHKGSGATPDASSACSADGVCLCDAATECTPDNDPPCKAATDCDSGLRCTPRGVCLAEGTCRVGDDCESGMVCESGMCTPGGDCGVERFGKTPVVPNLVLVLDRSCSMKGSVTGAKDAPTKWSEAVSSVDGLITGFGDAARWGLVLFPDAAARNGTTAQTCADDTFPVPVGDHTGPTIQSLLMKALTEGDPNYPNGPCVTPIDTAVVRAGTEPALSDRTHPSYLVLITDGRQAGCSAAGGEAGVVKTLGELAAKGVKTFVVGFGSAAADQTSLTSFAKAGETARPGALAFYDASDGASLNATLQDIVGSLVGCDFALDTPPPDTNKLYLFFDKTERVKRDPTHANGWDYDAKTSRVTLYGSACNKLRTGQAKALDIVYGCPGLVLE